MSPIFGACAAAGHTATSRITSHRITLLPKRQAVIRVSVACLLLRQRPDHRQHDRLALVSLYQQVDPQHETARTLRSLLLLWQRISNFTKSLVHAEYHDQDLTIDPNRDRPRMNTDKTVLC